MSEPSLAEVQRWMRWIITEPRGIHAALTSPWTLDPALAHRYKEPARQLGVIEEAGSYSARDRLGVYANAYFSRLLEVLATDYKTVHRVLGEETFHDVVAAYLMRFPSRSPNIGDVGETFPGFIKEHVCASQFPFLYELATLERSVMECLFTHHLSALDVRAFQTQSESEWAAARFVLDPAIRLVRVRWPVDRLWKMREQSEALVLPDEPDQAPRHLLLYRDDNWVTVSVMDVHSWTALQMLQNGTTLGAVCETLSKQWHRHSKAPPVMEWFSSWVTAGIVRNILWDVSKEIGS